MSAPEPRAAYFHTSTPVTGEPQVRVVEGAQPVVVIVRFGEDAWSPDIGLRDAIQARALAAAFTRAAGLLDEAAAGAS